MPIVCSLIFSFNLPLIAQQTSRKTGTQHGNDTKVVSGRGNSVVLTDHQQELALKFAADHHPELAGLLKQLRKTSPVDFERGIREIHNARQRVERYREKQPVKFQSELLSWQTDSKVRLLTARWAMSRDPELEAKIKELLRDRQQSKLDRMKAERDRLSERLELLNDQIGMGQAELEADLTSEWERLSKRAAAIVRTNKQNVRASTNEKNTSISPDGHSGLTDGDSKTQKN